MDKKIALSVLGFAFLAIAILLVTPTGKTPDKNPLLPWRVEILPNSATKVLGLTLGQSTLQDARQTFEDDGEVNLFVSPEKNLILEGYFNAIFINGIKADLVLSLSLDAKALETMYNRGARINKLDSGVMKVSLSSADMSTSSAATIQRITYIPAANLDSDMLEKRFGTPVSVIKEDGGIEHWLYPKIGLDVALNPNGKEVLQYVQPASFDEVTKPLLELKSNREQ